MTAANALPYAPPLEMPPIANRPLYPAVTPPVATQERLAKPHQRVTLHNTGEVQTQIIQDRFWQTHTLLPGAKAEIDMVVDEIATLVDLARTDRGFYMFGPKKGQPFPPHPVKVIGIPAIQARPITDREAELAQREAALSAREAELVEKER
jgi:hypothetical protein